jgi:hypothetical protein
MSYPDDEGKPVILPPQAIFIILTGSPGEDFAETFLNLCPFVTVPLEKKPDGSPVIAGSEGWVIYFPSDIYINKRFPVYYVKHIIDYFDVVVEFGYNYLSTDIALVEDNFRRLLRPFQASTQWTELVKVEDYFLTLATYQNPGLRVLSVTLLYKGENLNFIRFERTHLARLGSIGFKAVPLWNMEENE